MSAPTPVELKGKQKATDEDVPTFDFEGVTNPESLSDSSSDSDLDEDSESSSNSSSETGSNTGHEFGSNIKPKTIPNDPPLSRDALLTYLENLRQRFSVKSTADSFADQSEEVLIVTPKQKDLPDLNPGKLPESYFIYENTRNGRVTLARDTEVDKVENLASTSAGPQQYVPTPPPPPPEVGRSGKPLTKKEKKRLKTETAGKDWFDLPAPAESDLSNMYREYEALRLRNHLDPKRFYRRDEGESKGIKGLPKYFAIGTILPTKTPFGEPSNGDLTRGERKRTLVEELLDDSEAKNYAKKKFKQMQETRGTNGRGKHRKKQKSMRPKW